MANGQKNEIKYTISFDVDKKKFASIKSDLQSLSTLKLSDLINTENLTDAKAKMQTLKSTIQEVNSALNSAYNISSGTYNIEKFHNSLKVDLKDVAQAYSSAGAAGEQAFGKMHAAITRTQLPLKESYHLLKEMGQTLTNTIRWSISSTAINAFTGSVQNAWSFVKSLDSSLNDIMIVTEKSSDDMKEFAVQANKAAKALGATTKDYTKASLIYYQQGLSDSEVAARAEVTNKVANVTKQSTDTASELLTAVWNGYKVSAEEAELYVDKLSAVAASTASDLNELATGMSKVASAANIMGVDIDQLNAQLATIVSVTRESPESIGTALRFRA